MFRKSYQRGIFTILTSTGSKPLEIWEKHIKDGYCTRFLDPELKSLVVELGGNNVSTTYISCPKGNTVLGITMPFLIMIVKNLHKYFAFEVAILDESGAKRRFRVGNFQSTTTVSTTCTVMPICLEPGWNQIHFNLDDFTKRAYNKHYSEIQSIKINANIRLKRVYFTDKVYLDEELPNDFKLFFPAAGTKGREKRNSDAERNKENIEPSTPQPEQALVPQLEPEFKMDFPDLRRRRSSSDVQIKEQTETASETLTMIKPISTGSNLSVTPRQFKARSKESMQLSPPRLSTTKIPKHTALLTEKPSEGLQKQDIGIEAPIGSPKGKYNILVDALNVNDARPIL